jgi:hypothetical protein
MSIYKKLFEAKKEIGKISKDSTNPFFKSKYFDINSLLEHVEPILQKHDLLLLQPIRDGRVETRIYDTESKEANIGFVYAEIQLPNITDPQKLGSAITYYRRYTLQSLLGLQAEDDDGNKAAQPSKVWITEAQTQKAIDAGVETIKKTIAYYDGKTVKGGSIYCMKAEFKTILETALTV